MKGRVSEEKEMPQAKVSGGDPRLASASRPYKERVVNVDEETPDYKQMLALLCGVAGLIMKVLETNSKQCEG